MARACSICEDPRVSEIDVALLEGRAYRRVVRQFEASESAVYRHSKQHLPMASATSELPPVVATPTDASSECGCVGEPERRKGAQRVDLLEYMTHVEDCTRSILRRATAEGRHETALNAIRESRANVEVIAKLEERPIDRHNVLDLMKLSQHDLEASFE